MYNTKKIVWVIGFLISLKAEAMDSEQQFYLLKDAVTKNDIKLARDLMRRVIAAPEIRENCCLDELDLGRTVFNYARSFSADINADIDKEKKRGFRLLHCAESAEMAALLLEHKANPLLATDEWATSPLHRQAYVGNIEVVKMLSPLCNIDMVEKDGMTPLKHAVRQGHYELVKYLLHNDARDNGNINALYTETETKGDDRMCALLLPYKLLAEKKQNPLSPQALKAHAHTEKENQH